MLLSFVTELRTTKMYYNRQEKKPLCDAKEISELELTMPIAVESLQNYWGKDHDMLMHYLHAAVVWSDCTKSTDLLFLMHLAATKKTMEN